MTKQILSIIFLMANGLLFSQNSLITKRFKVTELDNRTFAPIVVNTSDGKTVMIFIRPRAIIGKGTIITLSVFDEKWNKIAQKEHKADPEIIKIMGQSREKLGNLSTDLFSVIENSDNISLFYERTDVVAHLKIFKKDWSIKQMPDIAFDEAKAQITIFDKNRSIIKTGVFNNNFFALVPHKEDNQLWLYSFDKSSKLEKKLISMPVVKQTKGSGKVKELSFNKFADIFQQDSLMVFTFDSQDDNDKIYQTVVLNLEKQKARAMKYKYPNEGFFKEKDKTHTMTYLFEDKILMSVVNDKKYALSIRNMSTGEELKNISFDIRKDVPIANSKITKRDIAYRGGLSNPYWYREKEIKAEKYWDNFVGKSGFLGSSPSAFGVIDVVKIDSSLRFSFGSEFVSDVARSSSRTDGGGVTTTKTSCNRAKFDCDIEKSYLYSYLGAKGLNPISSQKENSLEAEYEKIALLDEKITCLELFRKNEKDYFVYFDKKTNELVVVSLK